MNYIMQLFNMNTLLLKIISLSFIVALVFVVN